MLNDADDAMSNKKSPAMTLFFMKIKLGSYLKEEHEISIEL